MHKDDDVWKELERASDELLKKTEELREMIFSVQDDIDTKVIKKPRGKK